MRIVSSIAFLLMGMMLMYSAYLSWDENRINQQVLRGVHPLIKDFDLDSVPRHYSKPLKSAINYAYHNLIIDERINPIVYAYTELKPLDSSGWLKGSALIQRQGNNELSIELMEKARIVSRRSSFRLIRVFIRALELNQIDYAQDVFKEIVSANPQYFSKYFSVLSRLDDDYARLITNTIPNELPTFKEFEPDYYFVAAMRVALKQKNIELATTIWQTMPLKFRYQSSVGMSYLEILKREKETIKYEKTFQDIVGSDHPLNDFYDPDFEKNVLDIQPCFSPGKVSGASWFVDEGGYSSDIAYRVLFDGSMNVNLWLPSCTLVLQPEKKYQFSGFWRSSEITTVYTGRVQPG